MKTLLRLRESLGLLSGVLLAGPVGIGSRLRRARLFHPEGQLYRGEVTAVAAGGEARAVAARLEGPALVRLSGALFRGDDGRFDILGCALRLHDEGEPGLWPSGRDQDLLFATARSALTLGLAIVTTDARDFLRNDYYSIGLFDAPPLGIVQLRLCPARREPDGGLRRDRLEGAVRRGEARAGRGPWVKLAVLRLSGRAALDQAALRFSPMTAGRGLEPRGFLQALRRAPYRASQRMRGAAGG